MAKKTIKVTLIKSPIGTKADHRATLRGLGLSKMNQTRELEDTPAVARYDHEGCLLGSCRVIRGR